jgi:hypothetical protein
MVISVKETTIFSVFHPDAQDLYNTCSDLKKVAWELWDPHFRLNSAVGNLFSALCFTLILGHRIKQSNCSKHLHLCFASVLQGRSKRPFVRWVVLNF